MATVIYINGKTQSKAGMKASIEYVGQDYKTMLHLKDGTTIKLVSGQNVTPETAYEEFIATKETFGKTDKRQFYHIVQSFSPKEDIPPQKVHEAGVSLAKYFDGYEVLIATHIDKDHHHNHLIINSVNAQTGKKLSEGIKGIYDLRRFSDTICTDMGLSVLDDTKTNVKGMKTGEYRVAIKGDSWKFKLMEIIDDAMVNTFTKADFIKYMELQGYKVTWTDTRKSITYTAPNGMKVRDNKLHEEKYLKQRMDEYYGLRESKTEKQGGGNTAQTISTNNLRNASGTMGIYDEAYAQHCKWSDGASEANTTASDNKGNGRSYTKGMDEFAVRVDNGAFRQASGSIGESNKVTEGGDSSNIQTDSQCQREYLGSNNSKQQYTADKDNFRNESFVSDLKNLLAVDDSNFIKNTFSNVDLSHLKGDELKSAIKNLQDQSESIKARNERTEEDKKDASNLDMVLTLIEKAINNNEEDFEL